MNSKLGFSSKQEPKSDEDNTESDDSFDEDEDACELTENFEKTFFKTLSCLKKKDPQIYNEDARFFGKTPEIDENVLKEKRKKKKKEIAFTLREYEKKFLENDGTVKIEQEKSDDGIKSNKKSYVEEQKDLKKSFKKVLDSGSENDEDEIDGLFQERVKSEAANEEDDAEYRKWLKGQQNELSDKSTEGDMKFLHDYWNDPNLDQGEKFLRDYILNKRFLEKDDDDDTPDKLITLEEDAKYLKTQTEFEHKFNFRFEEPDQEFIKRYPRIMENSMRKKDDRRKIKREEIKQRKLEEKKQKMKELKKLQSLKLKEIEEKIKKIKEATGNDELGFKDEDIEKDFDPSEHDGHMQKLFSEEFYDQEDGEKPFFNDDLDLDQYKDEGEYDYDENYDAQFEPSCEDPDFNMDCDYTPEKAALAKKKKKEAREKKKNKKKGLSAKDSILLNQSREIPAFDKNLHKTFQNYLDEYYSLDCEDFIDDMPCRFKYRQVVPNSFGLSVEEILQADDKELNKWCSLSKVSVIRPENQELYDVKAYERKARNEDLKKKVLPSLYKSDDANEEGEAENNSKKKKKKKKKTNKNQINGSYENNVSKDEMNNNEKNVKQKRKLENTEDNSSSSVDNDNNSTPKSKKMKISVDQNDLNGVVGKSSDAVNTKKHKKDKNLDVNSIHSSKLTNNTNTNKFKKNKNKNQNVNDFTNKKMKSNKQTKSFKNKSNFAGKFNHNKHQDKKSNIDSFYSDISDSRLKAYGIKPKKFKNKLKYGSIN